MPKTVFTPRDELVCGKIDIAYQIARDTNNVQLADILGSIQNDCERMEQKLISRKDETNRLQEQLRVAKEALAVFSCVASAWDDYSDEEHIVEHFNGMREGMDGITVQDLRKARAALEQIGE